jgi:hypothetical protein
MYDEEKAAELLALRRKKQKLKKRIENDLRKNVQVKQQEVQIREDVRKERGQRQQKKEAFQQEKQTAEARKFNKKMNKVKLIKKDMKGGKGGKKTLKSRLDKLAARRKGKK